MSFAITNKFGCLEEIISCSICLDTYEEPKALPCLHSFCQKCIEPIIKNRSINCPECNRPSTLANGEDTFPSNFKLKEIIESVKKSQHLIVEQKEEKKQEAASDEFLNLESNISNSSSKVIPATSLHNVRNLETSSNINPVDFSNPFFLQLRSEVENAAYDGDVQYLISRDKCVGSITIPMIANYFEELGFTVIKDRDSCEIIWVDSLNDSYAGRLAKQNLMKRLFKQNEFKLGLKLSGFPLELPNFNHSPVINPPFQMPSPMFQMPNRFEDRLLNADVQRSTDYFLNYIKTAPSEYLYKHIILINSSVPNHNKIHVLEKAAEILKAQGFDAEIEDNGFGRKTMTIEWLNCTKRGTLAWEKLQQSNIRNKEITNRLLARIELEEKKSHFRKFFSRK